MRVERIRLDQHTLKIQLAEELLEFRVLVSLVGRVAALSDGQAQRRRVQRHLGNVDAVGRRPQAEPPAAVASIEPRSVLPSHTN